ncbi:pantetheine-phosphate adenylyltransferase [Eubacteriales bacterium OttesenSCG-928-K08]|nr:pantetheine-phosphate adenylyltransferase [Eubacteriales bacterium OttesenSCG-928-K08]
MKIGVYPGSFDPFTCGHMDVVRHASSLLDKVIVGVLVNSSKAPCFLMEERIEMINRAVRAEGLTNVETGRFEGLLVNYAHSVGAGYLIRGLRAVTDFDYEFQMAAMNSKIAPDICSVYFMAEPQHAYISSSIVKEIGRLGGPIDELVPEVNKSSIIERLTKS